MANINRLLVIAPEPSGDHLAAEFIVAVRKLNPNIEIKGMGGAQMAQIGVNSEIPINGLAVLGLTEALGAWRAVVLKAKQIANFAKEFRPDAVVLVDSWGFTLRAAKQIRKLLPQARLIKMVGPQVWATRAGRAKTLAQTYDELWCIHDFEVPYYDGLNIKIKTIGNPGLGRLQPSIPKEFIAKFKLSGKKVIGLLPGSRKREIENVLPAFIDAAKILAKNNPNLVFVTVAANAVKEKLAHYNENCGFEWLIVEEGEKTDAFSAMEAAMACSGTITSELGEAGVPIVVGYAIDKITYFIVRNFLIKTKFICLMNVAMGREIVRELLQSDLNGENLAAALEPLLNDRKIRENQLENQNRALKLMGLGEESAASNAARLLFEG